MPRYSAFLFSGILAVWLLALALLFQAPNGPATAAGTGDVMTSPDTGGYNVSLAIDASGRPVVAHTLTAATGDLKIVHCNDVNCAGANESIATVDTNAGRTSIALDGSGRPVVAYEHTAAGDTDLRVLRCGNANCTSGNTISSPDTTGNVGQYASIALDALDRPIVSYQNGSLGILKLLHCGDATCTGSNTITTLETNTLVGLYTSVALRANGNPTIAYYELSHAVGRVRHCNDASCTTSTSITPDVTNDVGRYMSLTLDASDHPVASYYDATNANLKVLRCSNETCTSGNFITTPDSAGSVGSYTSIALDAAGNPIVSYYDAGNGDLKLIHCGSSDCGSGNSIVSVDTAGNVGQSTSLRLDGAGHPIVAYGDITNARLKLLHCDDVNCAGPAKPTATPTPTPTPTPCPTAGCPPVLDTDGDGCTDLEELGPNEMLGGRRDPENPWDFYDVTADLTIDLFGDIFAVASEFGADADSTGPNEPDGYDPMLDRSPPPPGGDPWDMQAPDGVIDLFVDIFGVANQFGHTCVGLP